MTRVDFFVAGTPTPQGNKTAFVRGGRAVLVEGRRPEAREAFKGWRSNVTATAHDHCEKPFEGPVTVELGFFMAKPKSAPKKAWWADKRPDLDKLVRAVLDSLTGVTFVDDGQVVEVRAWKVYAVGSDGRAPVTTGVQVGVWPVAQDRAVYL